MMSANGVPRAKFVPICLFFISLFCLPTLYPHAQTGTTIGGIIDHDTSLPLSGSPYTVNGTITVRGANTTLTLEPGVELRFPFNNETVEVETGATLVAVGTAAQPIRFKRDDTAPQPTNWAGIHLAEGAHGSIAYADIGFAGVSGGNALRIDAADASVKNTTIHDSAGNGIYLVGKASPTFDHLSILNSAGAAMVFDNEDIAPDYGSNLVLQGNQTNGVILNGGVVDASKTYTLVGYPYIISTSAFVRGAGTVLTLAPGVEMRFPANNSTLEVENGGTLIAEGTAALPIRFTSAMAAPKPNDWVGVYVDDGGQASFDYCDIGYAGSGHYAFSEGALVIASTNKSASFNVKHCSIHDSSGNGIQLNGGFSPTFDQLSIRNCAGAAIYVNNPDTAPDYGSGLTFQGNHPNAVVLAGGVVDSNKTYSLPGYPYVVSQYLYVGGTGTTLTLPPGAALQFQENNSTLEVQNGARLIAEGGPGRPIRFNRVDTDPNATNWRGLIVDNGAQASFDYIEIGFAGYNGDNALYINSPGISVKHAFIHDSAGNGVRIQGKLNTPMFDSVTIRNSAGPAFSYDNPNIAPDYGSNLLLQGNHPDGAVILGNSIPIDSSKTYGLSGYTYVIINEINISGANTVLTLVPGVTVLMTGATYIEAHNGSKIVAEGTPTQPIRIGKSEANPQAGSWEGIIIDSGAQASFAYLDIGYAGYNGYGAINVSSPNVTMRHSSLHDNSGAAVLVNNKAGMTLSQNSFERDGMGVNNTTVQTVVNALYDWWGDPNGPKNELNPNATNGVAVSDGVLFQPWLGEADQAGIGATASPASSVLSWPFFTSDPAQVDTIGYALAVWTNLLPAPSKGDVSTLTLPYDFGGVEFTVDLKSGKPEIFSGSADGKSQFCVDGTWILHLTGPALKTLSGAGCSDPVDLAALNLPDGTYGGELVLTAPAGATTYGASIIDFLSDAYNIHAKQLDSTRLPLHFQADPVSIPVGTVGAVPVKLISSPIPFTGFVTHYDYDSRTIQLLNVTVPDGWSGGGGGVIRSQSNVGPLPLGSTAFTLSVQCYKPGNWPITLFGNAFGLSDTPDPNQNFNYLDAVAEEVTVSCVDPAPAATVNPGGIAIDPTDASLLATVTGQGFGAAAKANLLDGTGKPISASLDVKPSADGNSLVAHFPSTPAGIYGLNLLDGNGAQIGATVSVTAPPALPLFNIFQLDNADQIVGKKITHYWSLQNQGTADGVAVLNFGFPGFIQGGPTLNMSTLPQGSQFLSGTQTDFGWIENIAVPVKVGQFVDVSWALTVFPDPPNTVNPRVEIGDYIPITSFVTGSVTIPQWISLSPLTPVAAIQGANAQQVSDAAAALGGLSSLAPDAFNQIINGFRPAYSGFASTFFDQGGYAFYLDNLPPVTPPSTPPLNRPTMRKGATPLGIEGTDIFLALAALRKIVIAARCGHGKEAASEVLTLVLDKAIELGVSPVAAWIAISRELGLGAGEKLQESLIEAGFEQYETLRAAYAQGLDPNQPLPPNVAYNLFEHIASTEGFGGLTGSNTSPLFTAIASLYGGGLTEESNRISLTPEQVKKGLQALEMMHFIKRAQEAGEKDKSTWDSIKSNINGVFGGKPALPGSDPCDDHKNLLTASIDPNYLQIDPPGEPDQGWFAGRPQFTFFIHFENLPAATANAGDIRVETTLDPALDPLTVQPVDSSFKGTQFAFDPATGKITWVLPGINLPPNQNPPEGEGWVEYSASPRSLLATGTALHAVGQVFFDYNAPIITSVIVRTADNTAPTSQVAALPATETTVTFPVQWAGTDAGSGIMDYTVYFSVDGGPFQVLLPETTQTTTNFEGQNGHSYAFYSVARDMVGNEETNSAVAQTSTQVVVPILHGDVTGDGKVNVLDAILALQIIVGLQTATPDQLQAGDLNGSGKIDVNDAIRILQITVGIGV